jgi:hypothetical protein
MVHPAQLSPEESARVLQVLNCERFWEKAPAQVWATLLDEGTYLCSIRTMYRLLAAAGHGSPAPDLSVGVLSLEFLQALDDLRDREAGRNDHKRFRFGLRWLD